MPDYALFLSCRFNSQDGNFEDNAPPIRKPTARFWSEVQPVAGVLTAVGPRINADTKMLEAIAGTDRVYFAVKVDLPTAVVRSISFMCGIQMNIRKNAATTATPFRQGGEMQVNLTANPNGQTIQVPPLSGVGPTDNYDAIGAYGLVTDPGPAPVGDCCYYKLTVSASIKNNATNVIREFSHDPDMDVEL